MGLEDIQSIIKDKFQQNCPYHVTNYGKMIRSRLGVLILKSIGVEITAAETDILAAVELIHTSSLFHDDVIDNETIRRQPDTDNKTAVLYGNILLTNAVNLLIGLNNTEIIRLFNDTIRNMCKGELLQSAQTGTIPSIEEYLKKTELKTAALFQTMAKALKINGQDKISEEPVEFCRLYGIAFQIKNDLEDVLREKKDLKNGIYTAPFVLTKNKELTDTAIEKTLGLLDNYIERAKDCLKVLKESKYKKALIGEAECLKNLKK